MLHRLDHADIYLSIAGTYTPLALLALHGDVRIAVPAVIWTGAAAGAAFLVAWLRAPRWLYTSLYVVRAGPPCSCCRSFCVVPERPRWSSS